MSCTASRERIVRSIASCESVSTDIMALPPWPRGLVPKTPLHVDSPMPSWCSFMAPYVSS